MKWPRVVLPLLILAVCLLAARWILLSSPEPRTRSDAPSLPVVDAVRVAPTDYPVILTSQGTVQPSVSGTLVPEVAGSVVSVSPNLVAGGLFERDEVLVEIDRRDLEIALTQARASRAQALARLEEELALAERAAEDWQSLARGGSPSSLTLRQPQVAAAKADLAAAEASVDSARLNLERTRLIAPYAGRVIEKSVDAGQFVNRGTTLGRFHALTSVDIRLPLTQRQRNGLMVPLVSDRRGNVTVTADTLGSTREWSGRLIRIEGVDEATQQLTVVARIDDPYALPAEPLRVGQFVRARIAGKTLRDVFVVPRAALREDSSVLLLDGEGRLQRQVVGVAWTDATMAAISDGLSENDILVLTPLAAVTDGTPVRALIEGENTPLEPAGVDRPSASAEAALGGS